MSAHVAYKTMITIAERQMNVVIVEEFRGYWLAQVLEKDITSAGPTPQEALAALLHPISEELTRVGMGAELFRQVGPAPIDYRLLHQTATNLA